MNINGSNSSLFPRQPQGDQSNAVRRANNQIRQSCGGSSNSGRTNPWANSGKLATAIQNLIALLLEKLGGKTSPPPDEGARGVYGAPIGEIPPEDTAPPDGDVRAIYGAPVAVEDTTTSGS